MFSCKSKKKRKGPLAESDMRKDLMLIKPNCNTSDSAEHTPCLEECSLGLLRKRDFKRSWTFSDSFWNVYLANPPLKLWFYFIHKCLASSVHSRGSTLTTHTHIHTTHSRHILTDTWKKKTEKKKKRTVLWSINSKTIKCTNLLSTHSEWGMHTHKLSVNVH